MSDDLISRKALMQKVLQEEYDNDIHKDGRAKAIHHGEYQHFYKTISEMPTAYDVDKVIEKLEELREMVPVNRLLDDIIKDKPKELGQLMAYRKAIEIVKSGVVADE